MKTASNLSWRKVSIIALIVLFTFAILGAVFGLYKLVGNAFGLPALALVAIVILLVSLLLFATAMDAFGLSDSQQALGLPEGSVRAIIALSLVGLFAVLVASMLQPRTPSAQLDEFAKQMLTLIGTLMTAVSAFYFGGRSSMSARVQRDVSQDTPSIRSIESPSRLATESPLPLKVLGTNLNNIRSVRLTNTQDATRQKEAIEVFSNFTEVRATIPFATLNEQVGTWDVTVLDDIGRSAIMNAALTVAVPPKPTALAPSSAQQDIEQKYEITGTALQHVSKVTAKHSTSGQPVEGSDVTASANKVTVKFKLPTTGEWEVSITVGSAGPVPVPGKISVT